MTLEEKAAKYEELFEKYFIFKGAPFEKGTNIPLGWVKFANGKPSVGGSGDGPINMASYLLYLFLRKEDPTPVLESFHRLSLSYFEYFDRKFPNVEFTMERGFFMRDDISSDLCEKFQTNFIYSAWTGNIEGLSEDPCYSPVVSQDQIWNLLPVFSLLSEETYEVKHTGLQLGWLKYIVDHNHVIYDPYISTLLHHWTYLDLSVPYSDRKKVRKEKLKYKVKVKRGANNWYYSYGFRKALERMPSGGKLNKWINILSGMLYYPLTFCAEKIWFPLLQHLVGREPKNNSYYCLASAAKVWFFGDKNFWKTLKKQFYKKQKSWDLFMIETIKRDAWDEVDLYLVEKFLTEYKDPEEIGTMYMPLDFLCLYEFYKIAKEKKENLLSE